MRRNMLKIYIMVVFNRVPSSRQLERECQRNIELVWLPAEFAPDFKTIASSARTTARPFVRSAVPSWRCAASLIC